MPDQKRERKIKTQINLYHAALAAVKKGVATPGDLKLFEYALEASGEIGDAARAIHTEQTSAPARALANQETLKKRLKGQQG